MPTRSGPLPTVTRDPLAIRCPTVPPVRARKPGAAVATPFRAPV